MVNHLFQDVSSSDERQPDNRSKELSKRILLGAQGEMDHRRQPVGKTIVSVGFTLADFKVEGADQATKRKECMSFRMLVDGSVRVNSGIAGGESAADNNITRFGDWGVDSTALDGLDFRDLVFAKHVADLDLGSTNRGILDKDHVFRADFKRSLQAFSMDLEKVCFDITVKVKEAVDARELVLASTDKVSNLERVHRDETLVLDFNSVGRREAMRLFLLLIRTAVKLQLDKLAHIVESQF